MNSTKKIPKRTCIGCRTQKEKRSLIRIVRDTNGEISIDPTGRKNGRGAYLCAQTACLDAARKNHGLERSFECRIPDEVWESLSKELGSLEN